MSGCRGASAAAAAAEGPLGQQFVRVATVLAGLRELRMSLSARLRSLALGLPQLTDLQLNNCGDLQQLVLRCPRLERLSLQVGGRGWRSWVGGWVGSAGQGREGWEGWRPSSRLPVWLACVFSWGAVACRCCSHFGSHKPDRHDPDCPCCQIPYAGLQGGAGACIGGGHVALPGAAGA